jgi:outer membrane protease
MNVQAGIGIGPFLQRYSIRFAVLLAAILAWTSFAGPSFAQDWKLESSLEEKGFYDNNLLLTPNDELSSFGLVSTPTLSLERSSPTSLVNLTGSFPYSAYFNHPDLNAADQLVNLSANKSLSERSTIAFIGDFQHDTTLDSEQDISDRFLTKQVRFTRWDASPSWTYLLGPIDQMTLSANYANVDYDTRDKTDYIYYGPTFSYQHQLDDLSAVTASVNFNRFEPDDIGHTRTNVYGGLLGYTYTPSERLSVAGSIGMSYNTTTSNTQDDDSSLGYRLKFDLNYLMFDDTKLVFSLSHDSEPSGDGRQLTRNRARLNLEYQLSELTTFGLDSNYTDNEDYFGLETSADEDQGNSRYVSVAPSVTFQLTEELSLEAQYQYRHKMFQSDGGTATSNAAFLTLKYEFPTLTWGGF